MNIKITTHHAKKYDKTKKFS